MCGSESEQKEITSILQEETIHRIREINVTFRPKLASQIEEEIERRPRSTCSDHLMSGAFPINDYNLRSIKLIFSISWAYLDECSARCEYHFHTTFIVQHL